MRKSLNRTVKGLGLGIAIMGGFLLLTAVLLALNLNTFQAQADPIDPPDGYPKFNLSIKLVTPTLSHLGIGALSYTIEIINTGAYTAADTILTDYLPAGTSYNDDLQSNVPFDADEANGVLTWEGDIGFDSTAIIQFSVSVEPGFSGTLQNTAVISHELIAKPITITDETMVTDTPILVIDKRSKPEYPGANKPLTYILQVTNLGQPAFNLPITVTDQIPADTAFRDADPDGSLSGGTVIWNRDVTLALGESSIFTFSVDVGDVSSGTVLYNNNYQVSSASTGVSAGEPYTTTVIDPIFLLSKTTWPDPPGSNREVAYTLHLLNAGSLATGLIITDQVPAGIQYLSGGSKASGLVSWTLPSLDTGELAQFTFTAYISDIMQIPIINGDYGVCSDEGVCTAGAVLSSVVEGPVFETFVYHDPIAKSPGGGGGPVTPTIILRNLGPGNALDAMALIEFRRISVSLGDLLVDPASGTIDSYDCGDKCDGFVWQGDLGIGDMITFTTDGGQSTIGGAEGTHYTTTIVVTDSLSNMNTEPITGTAIGTITHLAYLIPTKSAPDRIGRGRLMTYTIGVWNSALSTDEPPAPWLVDYVPMSTILVSISDGGMSQTLPISPTTTIVSWTLPALSTGERLQRSFTVRVNNDLVSGTQLYNNNYTAYWYENDQTYTGILSNTGQSVTTTVYEVGLIDSFKVVDPPLAMPGPGNILTYYLHIVNSSPVSLTDVVVEDLLPWQSSTYQRDAVASAGEVVSDIVSFHWTGDVAALSSEVITLTVLVDEDFEGPITNTAVITHPSLLSEVIVEAAAYITDEPVLGISKTDSPDPVAPGGELSYQITVINLGQQATALLITDTVPAGTQYIPDSATAGGILVGDYLRWETPVLAPGASYQVSFKVQVGSSSVTNESYGVTCAEGVTAVGEPVNTEIKLQGVYLPLVVR